MIITLGIFSLCQLTFVPGLLIARTLRVHGFWENMLLAIGLSPIFNYVFVLLANCLGFFNKTSVLFLFAVESLLLLILLFPEFKKNVQQVLKPEAFSSFFNDYLSRNSHKPELKRRFFNGLFVFFLIMAVYGLYRYLLLYVAQPTLIFTGWDAVVSWDKWAMEWYQGIFPSLTWHYPQLIPINLSIPYQFIGTSDVKYFSKYFASLIEIFLLLAVFMLGVKKKRSGYFIGTFFTSWLMFAFGSRGSGYADTPVAFWALLSIVCLLFAKDHRDENKLLIIGAVFAAGAALTKQAGLWIILAYPILLILHQRERKQKIFPLLFLSIFIFIVLITPWYIYKEIQIRSGLDTSEIDTVTSLVLNGRNLYEIFKDAMHLFNATLNNKFFNGNITLIFVLIMFFASFKDRFWRRVNFLITIPFMFGWIFFFSYENRNVDLIIPLLGIAMGIGLEYIIEITKADVQNIIDKFFSQAFRAWLVNWLKKFARFFLSLKVWFFLLLIPLIFLLPLKISDERLISNSLFKQRYLGDPGLNQKLYDYYYENGLDGKILTQYMYLGFIPELKNYYEHYQSNEVFIDNFGDPKIGFALLNDHWISVEAFDYIRNLISEGKIKLIFEFETVNGKYYFVNSCHGVCH